MTMPKDMPSCRHCDRPSTGFNVGIMRKSRKSLDYPQPHRDLTVVPTCARHSGRWGGYRADEVVMTGGYTWRKHLGDKTWGPRAVEAMDAAGIPESFA